MRKWVWEEGRGMEKAEERMGQEGRKIGCEGREKRS